jgi:hypothetical protein
MKCSLKNKDIKRGAYCLWMCFPMDEELLSAALRAERLVFIDRGK